MGEEVYDTEIPIGYFEKLKTPKYSKEDAIILSKMLLGTGKNFNVENLINRGLIHGPYPFYYLIKSYEAIAETKNNKVRAHDMSFLNIMFTIQYEDIPLHINDNSDRNILRDAIIQWRLKIGK